MPDAAHAADDMDTAEAVDPTADTVALVSAQLAAVEKGVVAHEGRPLARTLRALPSTRRRLSPAVLAAVVGERVGGEGREALLEAVGGGGAACGGRPLLPEVEVYIRLLVLVHQLDSSAPPAATLATADALEARVSQLVATRRTLGPLTARAYFYHARAYERAGQLAAVRGLQHGALRAAVLRHDAETVVTVLNQVVRGYLAQQQYAEAKKVVELTAVRDDAVSSAQLARLLYYRGRIIAIADLDYKKAHRLLLQAVRKAPQHSRQSLGFRQTVHKVKTIVSLLRGEIPERAEFQHPDLRTALRPYFELTRAVRVGDLARFKAVVDEHQAGFVRDGNFSLIVRLRHNVIKAGLRKVAVSYSRIAFTDIAAKLHLDSVDDAEWITTKALADGVIEGRIDDEQKCLCSKGVTDVYATAEPAGRFNRRTEQCLQIRNEAIRGMRYPDGTKPGLQESEEERLERIKAEGELAQALENGDTDDDDDDEGDEGDMLM